MSSKAPSERAQSVKPEDKAETPKKQKSGDADEDPYKLPEENGKAANAGQKLPFPGATDLNSRLRRLIAAFQRESKKIEQKQAQIDKRNERRERIEQVSVWKTSYYSFSHD